MENISTALLKCRRILSHGLAQVDASLRNDIPPGANFQLRFAGYVAQQYIQKTTSGGAEGGTKI